MSRLRAQWDWVLGFSLMGLGALGVAVGSVGVSGSRYAGDQLSYIISGGLGGLLLLGAGATLVITAGLSDEWRKLDRMEEALPYPPSPGPGGAVLVRRGRLAAAGGMLVTAIFLAVAWARASGEADPEPGLEAVGLGVVGLIIGSLVAAISTMGLKRRVQLRKSRLFAPWLLAPPAPPPAPARNGSVLVADGLTRFHLRGCPSVAGLPTQEVRRGRIPQHLEPCQLCEAGGTTRGEDAG